MYFCLDKDANDRMNELKFLLQSKSESKSLQV